MNPAFAGVQDEERHAHTGHDEPADPEDVSDESQGLGAVVGVTQSIIEADSPAVRVQHVAALIVELVGFRFR